MSDTQTKLLSAAPATTTIGTGEYLAKVDANGKVTRISLDDLREAIVADVLQKDRGDLLDFNAAIKVGTYFVNGYIKPINGPSGIYTYGILETIKCRVILLQRYTSHRRGVAVRVRYNDTWTEWTILNADV